MLTCSVSFLLEKLARPDVPKETCHGKLVNILSYIGENKACQQKLTRKTCQKYIVRLSLAVKLPIPK